MNPRDYRTWTSIVDHPIFSPRAAAFAEWSSDPDVYADRHDLPAVFHADWYVHENPPLPAAVQAECATVDLQHLAAVCESLSLRYGRLDHELFILDDLTVYVHVVADTLVMDVYPVHRDESGTILMLFVESPIEIDELTFKTISEVVPQLDSLLGNT